MAIDLKLIPGKYNFVSSDKYDEFLEACGVGLAFRNKALKIKNQMEYIDHGDGKWTQKTYSTLKNFEITFTLGKPFVENTVDGRVCDSVITLEGSTFTHKQTLNGKTAVIIREFKADGELVSTFKAKDVVATRVYKKYSYTDSPSLI